VPHTRDDHRDRQLLGDIASGRQHALGELYDRHASSLFRHACALTRRRAEAEDLVQAVFVKLASTGAELLGVRTPVSYLHRIVKTTWLDGQRRTIVGERATADRSTVFPEPSPVDPGDTIDIDRALADLPVLQDLVATAWAAMPADSPNVHVSHPTLRVFDMGGAGRASA
jgi:DNA-directed RNA polymerase specialized sigma24 family protein